MVKGDTQLHYQTLLYCLPANVLWQNKHSLRYPTRTKSQWVAGTEYRQRAVVFNYASSRGDTKSFQVDYSVHSTS